MTTVVQQPAHAALTRDTTLLLIDAYWRAANFLPVGQIYLRANPLVRLGITLCPDRNLDAAGKSELSDATSRVGVFVIPAEENWMIAQASVRVAASSVR